MTNTQKLRVIRSRTDQDLVVVVRRELDRGMNFLNAARTRQSPLFAQAEKAWATATTLLPGIAGLTEGDRLCMETRANALRLRLDQVPAFANVGSFPASVAS